jgi:hypothetical protein
MKQRLILVLAVLMVSAGPVASARAQAPAPKPALVPLELEIVLSRYQGDRKIGSLPYTLNVNANGDPTLLNMGSRVPVPTTTFGPTPQGGGQPPAVQRTFTYENIGTNINVRANSATEGGFTVSLTIDDNSVASVEGQAKAAAVPELPVMRGLKVVNTLLLRDGQSRQFTAATDRVTGEVVKVEVTLKVLK